MKGCTIDGLCRLSGLSRQGYYRQRRVRQRQEVDETLVVEMVRRVRVEHPRMGARKLHGELKKGCCKAAVELGRDRFLSVLKRHKLLVVPKKKMIRTTYHDPSLPVYRNLLRELEPTAPNHAWVSDITYIDTDEGLVYLSLITDRYSRMIVGWNVGETMQAAESVKALQMAIDALPADRWPIHHSDRGSQYCCHEYVAVLRERDLPISMTEENHCYENAHAERVNGILKDEYNLDLKFRSRAQARKAITQAIISYNTGRPHGSLQLRKPTEVHCLAA